MLNELRFKVAFFTPYQRQGWSIIEVLAQEKTLFKATSRDLICITKKWRFLLTTAAKANGKFWSEFSRLYLKMLLYLRDMYALLTTNFLVICNLMKFAACGRGRKPLAFCFQSILIVYILSFWVWLEETMLRLMLAIVSEVVLRKYGWYLVGVTVSCRELFSTDSHKIRNKIAF